MILIDHCLEQLQGCLEKYSGHAVAMSKIVDQYLDTSLRRWVDLKQIFQFA